MRNDGKKKEDKSAKGDVVKKRGRFFLARRMI